MTNARLAVVALMASTAAASAQVQQRLPAAAGSAEYRDKIQAIRARLPAAVPPVTRIAKVRMKNSATGQTLGVITIFPPGADGVSYADWPVFAASKKEDGEGGGCGDDRFKFEPLPPDETKIPDLEPEDIPLNPSLIKGLKDLMGQKANLCGAAVGVYSGGRLTPGNFHLLPRGSSTGFDTGISGGASAKSTGGGQGSVSTTAAKTITCECVISKADRNTNSTSTCVCNAQDYPLCENCCGYYIRMQEKTGSLVRATGQNTGFDAGLANNCTVAPCPWQTGEWPWPGRLTGSIAAGLRVGIMDETRQIVTVDTVGPGGNFQLGAPQRPIRGIPVVCLVRSGAAPLCGNPGNPEPLIEAPGIRVQVSRRR